MATTDSAETDFSTDLPPEIAARGAARRCGHGPLADRVRRLRRNQVALAFGALFLVLIAIALPRRSTPSTSRTTTPYKTTSPTRSTSAASRSNVVSFDGVPIGPTWHGQYFLGADGNGRDVMVRLLYGGRNSLLIGIGATIITMILAIVFGLLAGYFRGVERRGHLARASTSSGRSR